MKSSRHDLRRRRKAGSILLRRDREEKNQPFDSPSINAGAYLRRAQVERRFTYRREEPSLAPPNRPNPKPLENVMKYKKEVPDVETSNERREALCKRRCYIFYKQYLCHIFMRYNPSKILANLIVSKYLPL